MLALAVCVAPLKASVAVLAMAAPFNDAAGVAEIVNVSVPVVAASGPRRSVTVLPLTLTVPAVSTAVMLVNPAGKVSVTVAPIAAAPPVLATVTV